MNRSQQFEMVELDLKVLTANGCSKNPTGMVQSGVVSMSTDVNGLERVGWQ